MRDRLASGLIVIAIEKVATPSFREKLKELIYENYERPQKLADAPKVVKPPRPAITTWPRESK